MVGASAGRPYDKVVQMTSHSLSSDFRIALCWGYA